MTTLALLGALFLKPALVLAAAAAITAGLRRHTAAARHAVWAGAIIAIVALPALSVILPPLRVPTLLDAIERCLPASRSATTAATDAAGGGTPGRRTSPAGGVLDLAQLPGAGPADRLSEVILVVWILGALFLGVRRVGVQGRVRGMIRRARPVPNPELARLLTDIARSTGIRRRVEIRLSDETPSPVVVGVFRPVVLLPTAAATWAEVDITAALAHELGHVARWDCLFNLIGDVATAVYWCNPALRLAARRMRSESEGACDDRVLRGGAEPKGYARLLLAVARMAREQRELPDATAMARSELESRVLAVLDASVGRAPLPRWMSVVLVGLGIILALPVAALTLRVAPLPPKAHLLSPGAVEALSGPDSIVAAPEPDRRADSLSKPASERVPLPPEAYRLSPRAVEALSGPDSILAGHMVAALGHAPEFDGDLIRDRAAWVLSQARNGRLVEPLLGALNASDWRVRSYAAWALATAHDPRAVTRLVGLLDHPVWRLRAMAAYALRESRDPRAEEAMGAALVDSAWQVRLEAVGYFAALGGPALPERLRPRLDDRHVAVRLAAEHALTSL